MDDAYRLLAENKLSNESFSDTLRRVLSNKKSKTLKDFFGILSDEEGEDMLRDLNRIKKTEIALLKNKLS